MTTTQQMVVTVMLSEAQLELARRMATLRNNPKVEAGTINRRIDVTRDDWEMHFDGTRAEVACGKYFGFLPDTSFSFGGDDKRPDLYVGEWRVEVKGCTHTPPILKLNALTDFEADAMVVCYVRKASDPLAANVELWGCVSRQRFIRESSQRDFGYGVRAVMESSQLAPVETLLHFAQRLPL